MKRLYLSRRIADDPDALLFAKEEMLNWRERTFSRVFITLMVISAIVYIPPLVTAIGAGLWWVGVNYFVSLLVLFLLVYLKKLPFEIRAGFGVLLLMGIGWSTLHMSGLYGSGRLWLFLCPIVAGMFLGMRAGLLALFADAAILFYYTIYGGQKDLVWHSLAFDANHVKAWSVTGSTFVVLSLVGLITIVSMLKFLEHNFNLSKSLQDSLEKEQERLKESNRLLKFQKAATQQYLDLAGIMLTIDLNLNIRMGNKGFCTLVGLSEEQLVGMDLFNSLGTSENRNEFQRFLLGMYNRDLPDSEYFEAAVINAQGAERIIAWHCRIFNSGQDSAPSILLYGEDITLRKQAEKERLKQEKVISAIETAGAVCHEMNQPLQALMLNTEIMIKRPSTELNEKRLRVLLNEISRMAAITNKLQKITSYETRDYVDGAKILDIDKSTS